MLHIFHTLLRSYSFSRPFGLVRPQAALPIQPDASLTGIGLYRFPAEGSFADLFRECAWSVYPYYKLTHLMLFTWQWSCRLTCLQAAGTSMQGELRLGIGHSARACLGYKGHKGVLSLQVKGVGALYAVGLHVAGVVEAVLVHQLGTDRGGIAAVVEAELEGEFLPEHLGPVVAHQLGAVLDKQRTNGVAALALAVGERQGAPSAPQDHPFSTSTLP